MHPILFYLSFSFLAIFTFSHSTVPLFLWSGEGYFGDIKQPHPETNGLFQYEHFTKDFMKIFGGQKNEMVSSEDVQDSLMKYVSKSEKKYS